VAAMRGVREGDAPGRFTPRKSPGRVRQVHPQGWNAKPICSVCGFNILPLHALHFVSELHQSLETKELKSFLRSGLNPTPDRAPFNMPNLKLAPQRSARPERKYCLRLCRLPPLNSLKSKKNLLTEFLTLKWYQ